MREALGSTRHDDGGRDGTVWPGTQVQPCHVEPSLSPQEYELRNRNMRVGLGAAGAALVAASALATYAGMDTSASASVSSKGGAGGDNGTVKVHDSETPADDRRNEPKVCDFYLVGFNFDSGEEVSWEIESWPPTGDRTVVEDGTLTLDDNGHGRTDDMSLPDGHYKLFWTFEGEKGKGKHKVFWVDCEEEPTEPAPSESDDDEAPKPKPAQTKLPVTG